MNIDNYYNDMIGISKPHKYLKIKLPNIWRRWKISYNT